MIHILEEMDYKKYDPIMVSADTLEFKFTSSGPKGEIIKVVHFTQTENPDVYNLMFGNLLESGEIDYNATNDNKDINIIFATLEASIYAFTEQYPDKSVFYKGSTIERTRLYRMALTLNFKKLSRDFEISGVLGQGIGFYAEDFVIGKEYFGFLLKRKFA